MKVLIVIILMFSFSFGGGSQYVIYEAMENLVSPRVIKTNDNNLLIYGYEYCYTPGSTVIEGCKTRDHFIKVNYDGEVIWRNTFDTSKGFPPELIKENMDGSFTFFYKQIGNASCNGAFTLNVNYKFGVFVIDSLGNRIDNIVYPDNCELELLDAKIFSDSMTVSLVNYTEFWSIDETTQTRIQLHDNFGVVLVDSVIGNSKPFGGVLQVFDSNSFGLFEIDSLDNLLLSRYNQDLEITLSKEIGQLKHKELYGSRYEIASSQNPNGEYLLRVFGNRNTSNDSCEYILLDSEFNVLSQNQTDLFSRESEFLFIDNEEIVSVSTNVLNDPDFDTQFNRYNIEDQSTLDSIIKHENIERPTDLVLTENYEIMVVGTIEFEDQPIKLFLTSIIIDDDQDGVGFADDCDDNNPNVNPNQIELTYNGIDDDCNADTLDDDLDQDGFLLIEDCDDSNPNINSEQIEEPYNGIDEDCDSTTLDDDLDQDGFVLADDCDDNNPNINPDADEIPNNGIDENCDGIDLITSIHELSNAMISIYPNPAMDVLNVEVTENLNYEVNVFDSKGRLIISKINQSVIEIETLPNGIYLIEIKDKESRQKVVERIVKG